MFIVPDFPDYRAPIEVWERYRGELDELDQEDGGVQFAIKIADQHIAEERAKLMM